MKNRIALAAIIGLMAMLILFVQVGTRNKTPRAMMRKANSGTGTLSANASGPAATGASSGKKESVKERRKRMMSSEGYRGDLKLTEQDVYMYVQAKGSNALSLVAAFESTRDKDYLKAAAEKFPTDPFVQAKALMWLDLSEAERAKLIEDFKRSAPTNSFANFLAAQAAMKRGDLKTALSEIAATQGKGYDEYFRDSVQGLQDAYSFAGYSEAEAKALGSSEITLPHLAQLKALGRQFVEIASPAASETDTKGQQEFLMANWQIGQQLRSNTESVPMITELVGVVIENLTLSRWPSGTTFDGQLPAKLEADNSSSARELRSMTPMFAKWFYDAPDQEIVTFMDIQKAAGERQAYIWLKQQHPELVQVQLTN